MARLRYNGLTATLGASLTSSATSVTFGAALTHSGGTAVPTISGSDYIPLTILTSAGAVSEIVYLTAYTSAGTTGTITRGQEGTTGVAHASGDKVVHGATAADIPAMTAWADLPLASGIVSHADNFGWPPQYRKNGDVVELRGIARKSSGSFSTTNTVIGTLPAGFRPIAVAGTAAAGDSTIGLAYGGSASSGAISTRVEIAANGEVRIAMSGSASWGSLNTQFSIS